MRGDAGGHEEHVGGTAKARAVIRRGTLVERPAPPNVQALHAHLLGLQERGFDAPNPVGFTPDGREQLTFVPGDVPVRPFPDWLKTTEALMSIGKLLRRLHEASADIPFDTGAAWPLDLADPEAGAAEGIVLCHNDVRPGNVVFRDGSAAALIDFDLSAPGRPLWDVAMAARYWAVLFDPPSAPTRLRVLADGYGLSPKERAKLPSVIEQVTESCRAFVAVRVADGDPAYVKSLADQGGWEPWDRLRTWLAARRETFTAALLD